MEEGRCRDVGLFRYSLVRPMAEPGLACAERGALARGLAGVDHVGPGRGGGEGGPFHPGPLALAYRSGGFDALVPAPRLAARRGRRQRRWNWRWR